MKQCCVETIGVFSHRRQWRPHPLFVLAKVDCCVALHLFKQNLLKARPPILSNVATQYLKPYNTFDSQKMYESFETRQEYGIKKLFS